ncbi:MAG: pectate lyase [Verrucomicrobia bacterium]|nr:MAG: pectate lyase [Verrucomicrobiota bacterium]
MSAITPTLPALLFLFVALSLVQLHAAVIGTNTPAEPLTTERIATLPAKEQKAWLEYLRHSEQQMKADQAELHSEMRTQHVSETILPPGSRGTRSIPLNRRAAWYASDEARHIADIVVSFQTPAGGWSKNLDLSQHPRAAAESFAPDNSSRWTNAPDNDIPHDIRWSYVGTFDNDATTTELRFLAKVAAANPKQAASYRAAFLRGLDYILAAQFPNGGWPQVWPLQGGYHDAITYNDGAMTDIMNLLREVSDAKGDFNFVPRTVRKKADASLQRGIDCILATQVVVDGHRTAWAQQHDALTLQPTSARNYEMPSLSAAESAGVAMFLMNLPKPSREVVAAVHSACAWFEKTKMTDLAYRFTGEQGRMLVAAPGNGPLWPRYAEIGSDRPLFGDRDKSIHDTVDEISKERRNGYAWFNDTPQRALDRYTTWKKIHPLPQGR